MSDFNPPPKNHFSKCICVLRFSLKGRKQGKQLWTTDSSCELVLLLHMMYCHSYLSHDKKKKIKKISVSTS